MPDWSAPDFSDGLSGREDPGNFVLQFDVSGIKTQCNASEQKNTDGINNKRIKAKLISPCTLQIL